MQIQCSCGYVITDVVANASYRGHLLRDQDMLSFREGLFKALGTFWNAHESGTLPDWIKRFLPPGDYAGFTDDALFAALLTQLERRHFLTMWQCRQCDRLYIQNNVGEEMLSRFNPEYSTQHFILARPAAEENA
jgi:hypothetical protein